MLFFVNLRGRDNTMAQYGNYTDSELANLLKAGDRDAFTEIYARFSNVLYVHAFIRLKSNVESMDIVQDLFVNLWNRRESTNFTNLSNYLYTAVRNGVLNIIAHKAVESRYLSTLPQSVVMTDSLTDHRLRERQLADIIAKEIELLPPRMRQVFQLSRLHNLSHKEIADQLGISEQAVRSHVKNALKILRVRLGLVTFLIFLLTR